MAVATWTGAAPAQETPPAAADTSGDLLRVFMDCVNTGCDLDFIRTEVRFVNFVRDRLLADVHVLVTSQGTGSGQEYMLEFRGQGARDGMRDTSRFATRLGDIQDDVRRNLVRVLSQGLVRYARGTSADRLLAITYRPPAAATQSAARGVRDPWNFWVYRIRANANLDGSSTDSRNAFFGSISANHITDNWKLLLRAGGDYSEQRFELTEGASIKRIQRSLSTGADIVRSLDAHWSAGVRVSADRDLFRNFDASLSLMPGIEYNIFPYSESTRRQLVTRYSVGVRSFDYVDTTIFSEVAETRPQHSLVVSVSAVQPWGRAAVTLNGQQYLHDRGKRQFGVNGSMNWRIVRGLEFNIGGGYSYLRDQLNIRKAGLTDEEIIIRLREQSTSYRYFMFTGLSFTFGSAFSNIVNTRFGGGDVFFFF